MAKSKRRIEFLLRILHPEPVWVISLGTPPIFDCTLHALWKRGVLRSGTVSM